MAKSKKDKPKNKREKKKVLKKETKKSKKKSSSSSDSSDSSQSSKPDFSAAELAETLKIAETFGLKEKQLTFSKNIAKISDLSTAHLCTTLALTIPDLTAQALFQCGGELYEVRKRCLQTLRADGTPESLKLRLELSQRLSVAERKWRSRLEWILQEVCGMGDLSVISQHHSVMSLRRSVGGEVEQKKNAADDYTSWLVKLKQKLTKFKGDAETDLKNEQNDSEKVGTTGFSESDDDGKRKRKKKKGKSNRTRKSKGSSRKNEEDNESESSSDEKELDRSNVKACLQQARRGRYEKLARGNDGDLFAGRFGGKNELPPLVDGRTSSTRPSIGTRLSKVDDETIKEAEVLGEFLDTELKTFFGASADAQLFIKVLIADGIVSPEKLMMALSNEWSPALCGSEAKEVFGCLSWMGRQSTTRLVKHLTKHMDELKTRAESYGGESDSEETLELSPNVRRKKKRFLVETREPSPKVDSPKQPKEIVKALVDANALPEMPTGDSESSG